MHQIGLTSEGTSNVGKRPGKTKYKMNSPACAGKLKIIATSLKQPIIEKISSRLS